MASTDTKAEPKFTLHEYVPSDKPGHYDDEVQALMEAGDGIAITVQIPGDKDPEKAEKLVKKHQAWFYESARRFDRSAKLVDETNQEDGSIHLDFILRNKITRPRKAKANAESVPEANSGAPAEGEKSDTPKQDAA